jgi:hypothetical protein
MAQAKAKKLNTYRDKYFTVIEYANGWQICCTPAWVQHRDEQAKIDEMLDNPKPAARAEHKPIEEQMEEIWKTLGW